MIKRRSQSFSERRRSFSCFSSFTCFSSSRADISRAASRCFFLIRKRALAKVFRRRLSSSKASRFVSASVCELPVFASFTRSDACAVEAPALGIVTDTSGSCFSMGEGCCCDSADDGDSGFARLDSADVGSNGCIGGSGCSLAEDDELGSFEDNSGGRLGVEDALPICCKRWDCHRVDSASGLLLIRCCSANVDVRSQSDWAAPGARCCCGCENNVDAEEDGHGVSPDIFWFAHGATGGR